MLGLCGVEMAATFRDECIAQHAFCRHVEVFGVTDKSFEIRVRELLRFDQVMQIRGRVVTHRLEIERLQDAQHFERRDALVVRRQLPHAKPAERHGDRRDPRWLVLPQVIKCDEAVQRVEPRHQLCANFTTVECTDALGRNDGQRARVVCILKPVAGVRRLSARQKGGRGGGVLSEQRRFGCPLRCNDRRDRKSVARIMDRRLQCGSERALAVRAHEHLPSGQRAGNGDRFNPLLRARLESAGHECIARHA